MATLVLVAPLRVGQAGAAPSLVVTGYIEQGSSPLMIGRSASALSTVGIDGINLVASGNHVATPDASTLALLSSTHADGLRGELLVGNFDNAINDFSATTAGTLLHSAANMRSVSRQLAHIVASEKWDGITVDLESLDASDAGGLTTFLTLLRRVLPAQCSLEVDVQASTTLSGYEASGYQLASLGRVVDRVVLMAYDQHGPWSQPGPIGALNWQRQTLKVLLSQVGAAKVDLGVAGYGYTWPKGSRFHDGNSISDALARRLVTKNHVVARWDARSGEWTARLRNGTRLWWSDHRSYQLRRALATSLQLHGLALWQLASADPLVN
ncbi:MAG: glycosyl hydrolase family 18 protein [Acidimicrobiales bacterium]